MSPVMLAKLD